MGLLFSHICHKWFSQGQYIKRWSIQFHASCINTLIPNRNYKGITVAPDTNQGKYNDRDVIRKGNYYQVLNENGKKIEEVHESSVGELQGFTDRFIVFRKGSYFATYDETFRKIEEIHESTAGVFKGAAGQYMIFIKGNYAVTFDLMFKKISERYV